MLRPRVCGRPPSIDSETLRKDHGVFAKSGYSEAHAAPISAVRPWRASFSAAVNSSTAAA